MKSLVLLVVLASFAFAIRQNVAVASCDTQPYKELVAVPFVDLDDAFNRLVCISHKFYQNNDQRIFFSVLYTETTFQARAAIREPDSMFVDRAWMEVYTMTFADIYRQHLYNWEYGDQSQVPESWVLAFEHAAAGDLLIVQDIVLGINGHINKDLSNALYQVGVNGNQTIKHSDSTHVNDVILVVYEQLKVSLINLYAPVLNATYFTGAIDKLVDWTVEATREQAWQVALILNETPSIVHRLVQLYTATSSAFSAAMVIELPKLLPDFGDLLKIEGSDPISTYCSIVPWNHCY